MSSLSLRRALLACLILAHLVACGGGASEPESQPNPAPTSVATPAPTTFPPAPTPTPPIEPPASAPAPAHGTLGSGGAAGPRQAQVSVNGVQRSYFVYAPNNARASATSEPVPLVIALHGAGDRGDNFVTNIGLTQSADAKNYVLVAADAYVGNSGVSAWLLSATQGWPGADGSSNSFGNDLQLITRIVQDIGMHPANPSCRHRHTRGRQNDYWLRGCQRCGSSSSIWLFNCVGKRVSTSFR